MGVTNTFLAEASGLLGNTGSKTAFNYLAYGTGLTAFAKTQTALVTESQRAAATVSQATTSVTDDTLQLTKTFSITTGETISEVGAFNASSSGTMAARTLLASARTVVNGDSFVCTYKIIGTN